MLLGSELWMTNLTSTLSMPIPKAMVAHTTFTLSCTQRSWVSDLLRESLTKTSFNQIPT